jgi:altronate dehydratase
VSIWRDWRQTDRSRLDELRCRPAPDGRPIPIRASVQCDTRIRVLPAATGCATDQVGLILPTSLCSGQIAACIAQHLNATAGPQARGISRFVALPHTEGCGASAGENEEHQLRTFLGHLQHPFVKAALLLEHGCERTHNDLMRHALERRGIDTARFGFASIQLDGGIEKVSARVERWFLDRLPQAAPVNRRDAGLEALSLGLLTAGSIPPDAAGALGWLTAAVVCGGSTVVIPEHSALLRDPAFLGAAGCDAAPPASLAYGEAREAPGLHVMAAPTDHGVEILTGLGGTGVQIVLAHVEGPPLQGHPMIPVLQFTADIPGARTYGRDFDLIVDAGRVGANSLRDDLLKLVCDTASHDRKPRLWAQGYTDFQLTRGLLGVSL